MLQTYGYLHNNKPWSFGRSWTGEYVPQSTPGFQEAWNNLAALHPEVDRNIIFSAEIVKINRACKSDKRFLFVTNTHLIKFDPKDHLKGKPWKMKAPKEQPKKNLLAINDIKSVSMSKGRDSYMTFHNQIVGQDWVLDFGQGDWERASELLSLLITICERRLQVDINAEITFNNCSSPKPEKVAMGQAVLTFMPDPMVQPRRPGDPRDLFVKQNKTKRHQVMCTS